MTKKEQEENEKKKPKFLTAKQREQIALEKRKEEVEKIKRQQEEARKERQRFLEEAKKQAEAERKPSSSRSSRWGRDSKRGQERNSKRSSREATQEEEDDKKKLTKTEVPPGVLPNRDTAEAEKEMEEIKKQYLGIKEQRKRVIKPSEKYARVFDWDLDDDTSKEHNQIYKNRTFFKPGYGKGFIAGIDPEEQIKEYRKQLPETKREKFDKIASKPDVEKQHNITRKHWSEKLLEDMTDRDWRIFKEDFNISARGRDIPRPIRSWRESELPASLLDAIEKVGYKTPTPIQMQAIPIALRGRDILGVAETGSGKTAAFLLPMLVYLSRLPPMDAERKADGPYALIMAPVRELALQIEEECKKFARYTPFRTVCLVGGQNIGAQGIQLEQGCEVIIATPGRMIDCLRNRYAVLNQCNYVVLDEADRMIDMGFISQVNEVLESMPQSLMKSEDENEARKQEEDKNRIFRTTIMYSATMPTEMESLARTFLRHPAYVAIGEVGKAVDRIKQRVIFVHSESEKNSKLLDIIENGPEPPIIVFANTKKTCDMISKKLNLSGYPTTVLHASKSQEKREYALEAFRDGRFDILVATDVAGRGLDIQGVTHVINYDLPKMQSHYIHRIGRTGRAGLDGLATSFISDDDTSIMWFLKKTLTAAGQPVPNELAKHPAAQFNPELAEKIKALNA